MAAPIRRIGQVEQLEALPAVPALGLDEQPPVGMEGQVRAPPAATCLPVSISKTSAALGPVT